MMHVDETDWRWLRNRSKRFLENWILETIDNITDKTDPRIKGLYIAASAIGGGWAGISDTIITFENLLLEKGVDVGKHICMPAWICNAYGM